MQKSDRKYKKVLYLIIFLYFCGVLYAILSHTEQPYSTNQDETTFTNHILSVSIGSRYVVCAR